MWCNWGERPALSHVHLQVHPQAVTHPEFFLIVFRAQKCQEVDDDGTNTETLG